MSDIPSWVSIDEFKKDLSTQNLDMKYAEPLYYLFFPSEGVQASYQDLLQNLTSVYKSRDQASASFKQQMLRASELEGEKSTQMTDNMQKNRTISRLEKEIDKLNATLRFVLDGIFAERAFVSTHREIAFKNSDGKKSVELDFFNAFIPRLSALAERITHGKK